MDKVTWRFCGRRDLWWPDWPCRTRLGSDWAGPPLPMSTQGFERPAQPGPRSQKDSPGPSKFCQFVSIFGCSPGDLPKCADCLHSRTESTFPGC